MHADQDIIVGLVAKYARRETLTEEERLALDTWLNGSEKNRLLAEVFRDAEEIKAQLRADPARSARIWSDINQLLDEANGAQPVPLHRRPWVRRTAAAAAILVLGVAGYYYYCGHGLHGAAAQMIVPVDASQTRVAMQSMAVLTRVDGSRVNLDTFPIGAELEKGTVAILRKIDSNAIGWDMGPGKDVAVAGVSVGEEHPLVTIRMPDSSQVILSSGANLSLYLSKHDRNIRINDTGKIFFAVQKDTHHPFRVRALNGTTIDVLGTQFQVEACNTGRQTRVALVSGQLRVTGDSGSVRLTRPSQEAVVSGGRPTVTMGLDSAQLVAWATRAMWFNFKNRGFDEALHEVAAWYGCTIRYIGKVKGVPLTGQLLRSGSLDDVLAAIGEVERGCVKVLRKGNVIEVLR